MKSIVCPLSQLEILTLFANFLVVADGQWLVLNMAGQIWTNVPGPNVPSGTEKVVSRAIAPWLPPSVLICNISSHISIQVQEAQFPLLGGPLSLSQALPPTWSGNHRNTCVVAMSCVWVVVLSALLIIVWWNPQVLFATPSDVELFQDPQYCEGHRRCLASCQNKPIEGLNNNNNCYQVTDLL